MQTPIPFSRQFAAQRALRLFGAIAVLCQPCGVSGDVFTNVPEASADGYQLVYTLPIQDTASYNLSGVVPYSVDNSAAITSPFDRIAYYLELDSGSGLQYAYASMDAFTSNIAQVGLPIDGAGANFQRTVSNLNVVSNSPSVAIGTGIQTGNIELWPRNYSTDNAIMIPGADNGNYDFGDRQSSGGNYGSFQVHNYGANQTILAYNSWGGEPGYARGEVGIGNAQSGNPDWTFADNVASFSVKNLQVLVRPADLAIDSQLERAIFQRDQQNQATVPISGLVLDGVLSVEARAIPRSGSPGRATDWQVIDSNPTSGAFAGSLTLDGGWYDIEVRSIDDVGVSATRAIERVGVGEVFVIAGQSNSANYGDPPLAAVDDRISAFDYVNWRHADDPQPIATSSGGSPWPALGDALAADLDVPIGFISVGWGGTSVGEWLPGAAGPSVEPLYNRLRDALQALGPGGARAVLWHQGEADNLLGTTTNEYVQRLEAIVSQSRTDAGFDVPWGIAQASFVPGQVPAVDQEILDAQTMVASNDPLNFVGALTDDLTGPAWRWDGIHFNEPGLREHAQRWFDQLVATFSFPDASLFGDFDSDLALACADADALVAAIANDSTDLLFDLTGDALVDEADLALWLTTAGILNVGAPYLDGDANLDGTVDGQDFIAWNNNKFTTTAAWCAGDFTADGVVDGQDFLEWNQNKFSSSNGRIAVPEPTCLPAVLLVTAWLSRRR